MPPVTGITWLFSYWGMFLFFKMIPSFRCFSWYFPSWVTAAGWCFCASLWKNNQTKWFSPFENKIREKSMFSCSKIINHISWKSCPCPVLYLRASCSAKGLRGKGCLNWVWKWPSLGCWRAGGMAREQENRTCSYSGGHKETRWAD